MISQSAAAVDLNVDAGTFYVDTTNNRVGVGGKTDPDTPLHVVGTVTATLFAGSGASLTSIPNSALVNSSITINSTATSLGGSITLGTDDVAEGSSNLYYTNARADARIAAADTDDLSEGSSNLYYTDARVDARVSGGSLGNITTTGYIRGPATFTIDPAAHGDNTGTVVIAGNLQVDGTQTVINSTTLTVDDKNITLASGSANAAAASGAGFTVDIGTGTNPAITYDGTNDEWDFNKPLNVTGNIAVSGTVDGVDIAARDAVLTSTTTTAGAALPKAGGIMTGALTVKSPSATGEQLILKIENAVSTGAIGKITFNQTNDEMHLSNETSGSLVFATATVEKMRIDSLGNVLFGNGNSHSPKIQGTTNSGRTPGSPGYSFNDDLNTGMFQPVSTPDTIAFSTGGTERLRIKSDGNVGIGTDAPQTPLHVKKTGSTSAVQEFLRLENHALGGAGAGSSINFHHYHAGNGPTGGAKAASINAQNMASWPAGSPSSYSTGLTFSTLHENTFDERMRIKSNGSVGIGTNDPVKELHVDGTFVTEGGARSNPTGINNAVVIDYQQSSGNTGRIRSRDWDGATWRDFAIESANINLMASGNVGIGTTAPEKNLSIGSSQAEGIQFNYDTTNNYRNQILNYWNSTADSRMDFNVARASGATPSTIMSVGYNSNVGIGTASPAAKLHIHETVSSGTGIMLTNNANTAGTYSDILWQYSPTDSSYASGIRFKQVDTSHGGQLEFYTDSTTGSYTQRMTITENGYVGIGTDTPAHPFHITKELAGYQAYFNNDNGSAQGIKVRIKSNDSGNFNMLELVSASTGSDVTAMVVRDDGNVGIGTAAPGALLDLETAGNTVDGSYYSTMTINNTGSSTYSGIRFDRSAVAKWRVGIMPDDKFQIAKLYNGVSDDTFVINSNGNVGVGTANPDATLHVNGAAIIGGNRNNYTTPAAGLHVLDDTYSKWSTTLSPEQCALRVETYWNGSDGHPRAAGDYGGGIVFNHLGGHSAVHGKNMHCWIGPRIWDLSGHERAGLVFATNDDVNTSPSAGVTTIEERMVIDPYGNVGIGISPAGYVTSGYALRLDGGAQTYLAFNNNTHTTQVLGGFVIGNDSGAARITQRQNQPMIFATNDTTAMTIAADGIVTKPMQPAFSAYANTNETTAAGGIAPYDALIFDQGSNYTTSTRRFTAPVAGIYHFSTYSNINGVSTGNAMWYAFAVNGAYRGAYMYQVAPTSSWNWLGGSQTIKLAQGDYVQVKSGTSMHWDMGNAAWSNFSGHLVG